mmetsp:Transcript_13377/g.24212  ORF Transcript_13377/g.24212 Transcript_13377/m.24212 type:complete len:112 (-) Transcript_13377:178-513(-)
MRGMPILETNTRKKKQRRFNEHYAPAVCEHGHRLAPGHRHSHGAPIRGVMGRFHRKKLTKERRRSNMLKRKIRHKRAKNFMSAVRRGRRSWDDKRNPYVKNMAKKGRTKRI